MTSDPLPTSDDAAEPAHKQKVGLLAGEGAFPLLLARAARDRGVSVYAYGLPGVTPAELEREVDSMRWVNVGQLQKLIDLLHQDGVEQIVMAGRVKHNIVFQLARMDMRAIKLLGKIINKKADTILGTVVREFTSEGIETLDSTIFLRSMMPPAGLLTRGVPPNEEIAKDIEFGHEQAKAIAGLDIGQTVAVKSQSVVAVEAMEGTDETIERAGRVAGEGVVVVKVSKPMQDKRFDVPVLGLTTVQKLVEARAAALAFSGGQTLFFDQEQAVALAEANGIAIIGV